MSVGTHEVKVKTWADGKVVELNVHGKLTEKDCEEFIPVIDAGVELHGQVRLLFNCEGFEGWTMGGMLEDIKFGLHHYNAIFRLAIVGDKKWEKAMATAVRPFTKADVNYYDITELELARAWLREGT
ncbi:STAS/SEC14 domain-containing protein [Pelagicoccus albus]|uniref:STAS/SEC14 domain-containing protein n=1 Tax=Pelagicoccus albus TaxID=415222 RepID=A0A7X1E6Q4_9BACT|nr:STAS/SEC14 domain-containing protein [Pelagicoccus albus]MBC2604955.1 STAS/SEC14 domain-containing protein [Pelagicoccus albus]